MGGFNWDKNETPDLFAPPKTQADADAAYAASCAANAIRDAARRENCGCSVYLAHGPLCDVCGDISASERFPEILAAVRAATTKTAPLKAAGLTPQEAATALAWMTQHSEESSTILHERVLGWKRDEARKAR